MKVIGIVGMIGAGKDAVNEYMQQKYRYQLVHMGNIVREIAAERKLEPDRDNLDAIQKEYREKYGDDYFAREVVRRIKKEKPKKVIINGIRTPSDAEVPKKEFGKDMILIQVDADPKLRFERMSTRARPGDPATFEEFKRQDDNQSKLFNLKKTLSFVDHKIMNNSTLEKLHKQVDNLLKKTGFD